MTSSRKSKRNFERIELAEAAQDTVRHARKNGVKIALLGGYALQLYGSPRFTSDLDFVVSEPTSLEHEVVEELTFGGVAIQAFNDVPVDLICRSDDYAALYQAALDTAHGRPVIGFDVVTKPFLAAMKMASGRAKDHADLEWLIVDGDLDIPEARIVIKTFLGAYAAREFDELVMVSKWKAGR